MRRSVHKLQKPKALRKGSRIGIVFPSSPAEAATLSAGIAELRRLGFQVPEPAELAAEGWELTEEPAIAIEPEWAEARYADEPEGEPEAIFHRRWALTMLDQSLARVRKECAASGSLRLFDEIKGTLAGGAAPQAEIAARLGMSEGALSVAIHRLRKRCREALRHMPASASDHATDAPGARSACRLPHQPESLQ